MLIFILAKPILMHSIFHFYAHFPTNLLGLENSGKGKQNYPDSGVFKFILNIIFKANRIGMLHNN
jgi:hypothetical protein